MARIPKDIEDRIKRELKPTDVLEDIGCTLHRVRGNWVGRNPFRDDKHAGSFIVNDNRGLITDFSMGPQGHYSTIDVLMKGRGLSYHDALRYGAAMLDITIDDTPAPVVKKCEPRPEPKELPMIYWPGGCMVKHVHNAKFNPLLQYLAHLPLTHDDKERLLYAIAIYEVGTSIVGATNGWTIWPYKDEFGRVRSAKLMKYKSDGHRDKNGYNFNWMHSMTQRWKEKNDGTVEENKHYQWDNHTHAVKHCLFGLHLLNKFPTAEICIVESEKTALICSTFYNMTDKVWMATGGKSALLEKLWPLMDAGRKIVFYPDHDGYQEWVEMANTIEYDNMEVSRAILDNWTEADGDKADIGDILLRMLQPIAEKVPELPLHRFGLSCNEECVEELVRLLDLKQV